MEWALLLVCTLGVHPCRSGHICLLCTYNICQLDSSKNCFVGYIIIALGLQDKYKKVAGQYFSSMAREVVRRSSELFVFHFFYYSSLSSFIDVF